MEVFAMTSPTQTPGPEEVKPGHWWKEPERVSEYIARWDQEAGDNAEPFGLLTRLLPFAPDAPIQVLDIGSGHGVLAAAILDAFPAAKAVGLDISEPMMREGRERMARFGDRFCYFEGDFAEGTLPSGLVGPFDVTVSSRAIHHLPPEGKRRLYADIFQHTAPGGCCFNVDNMRPRDEFLRQRYSQADPSRAPTRPAAQP